ncbi:MAG: hypothetical protein JWO19_988 [Bryobacterales bacterium]|jgi:hypothetical protein|nr:hypothetical protein [Bryobacterales bacterium]
MDVVNARATLGVHSILRVAAREPGTPLLRRGIPMALARCDKCGLPMESPESYTDRHAATGSGRGVRCGATNCVKLAYIWLTASEQKCYIRRSASFSISSRARRRVGMISGSSQSRICTGPQHNRTDDCSDFRILRDLQNRNETLPVLSCRPQSAARQMPGMRSKGSPHSQGLPEQGRSILLRMRAQPEPVSMGRAILIFQDGHGELPKLH